MINTKTEFMDMVRKEPTQDNCLVFADWLEENGDHKLAEQLRAGQIPFMLRRGDNEYVQGKRGTKFSDSIIAQDDDEDYSESGYVVVRIGDWCAIARYGHCSCFGTWASITGGGISDSEGDTDPQWDWQGTHAQLLDMARRTADPSMPERAADPEDSDYDHLQKVYQQVLAGAKA